MTDLSTEYAPQVGDVIVFPDAPMTVNRTMRYIVTGTDGRIVMFEHEEGRGGRLVYPIGKLRAIGMRKAVPLPGQLRRGRWPN